MKWLVMKIMMVGIEKNSRFDRIDRTGVERNEWHGGRKGRRDVKENDSGEEAGRGDDEEEDWWGEK